jgi:hypothetical protein
VASLLFDDDQLLPNFEQALNADDVRLSIYDVFRSGPSTATLTSALLSAQPLSVGFAWVRITRDSPAADVRDFQTLASACDVAPPSGYVMRGTLYGTDCYLIRDAQGQAAATGAVIDRHQPWGTRSNQASSGLVAVRPDLRKAGLGRLVYAKALSDLLARRPTVSAYTAVKKENAPSRNMCEAVGLKLTPGHKLCLAISNRTYGTSDSFTR